MNKYVKQERCNNNLFLFNSKTLHNNNNDNNNNNSLLMDVRHEDDPVVLKYVECLWLQYYIELTLQSRIPRPNTKHMFRDFLTTNNYFHPKQHLPIGLSNVTTLRSL
jgi:hypothetical protein